MNHRNLRYLGSAPGVQNWRAMYTTALFESDWQRLPERIAEAERVLVRRAGELLKTSGDNIEEEQAVDDALYRLRALARLLYDLGNKKTA